MDGGFGGCATEGASETAGRVWRGVHAVVFTYNRKALVARCLAALQRQSVRPERIVLIDNGSTDGTRAYLAAAGLLADPAIDYVRLDRNLGAAGGVRAGMIHAWRQGCRFAWVMDDDLVCAPTALAELKRVFEEVFAGDTARLGFLVPQLVDRSGRANNVPQLDERSGAWAEHLADGVVRIRISSMTGILLPRATLEHCGAPAPDFFIWGEDTDYTLRVTAWRPGFLVGAARAVHLRGVGGYLDIFTEHERRRVRDFYYLYRNTTYLRRRYWPARGLVLFLVKAALHFCRALRGGELRWLRARVILAGTLAGIFFAPRHRALSETGDPEAA